MFVQTVKYKKTENTLSQIFTKWYQKIKIKNKINSKKFDFFVIFFQDLICKNFSISIACFFVNIYIFIKIVEIIVDDKLHLL